MNHTGPAPIIRNRSAQCILCQSSARRAVRLEGPFREPVRGRVPRLEQADPDAAVTPAHQVFRILEVIGTDGDNMLHTVMLADQPGSGRLSARIRRSTMFPPSSCSPNASDRAAALSREHRRGRPRRAATTLRICMTKRAAPPIAAASRTGVGVSCQLRLVTMPFDLVEGAPSTHHLTSAPMRFLRHRPAHRGDAGGQATIDRQHRASDHRCAVGHQEGDSLRHILRVGNALQRA